MTDADAHARNAIHQWVWSGFYSRRDVERMLADIVEPGQDMQALIPSIEQAFRQKQIDERSWPEVTFYDRLHAVFYDLHEEGICALHNAGYDMSDGHTEVSEAIAAAPTGHYHGFCFYHGQDVERAIASQGLMIAYGSLAGDAARSIAVGQVVAQALEAAGFPVQWDGTVKKRLFLPDVVWQKRGGRG